MSIYEQLFDYQKNVVDNNLDKQAFGLFLDMGLGKTPVSLTFAEKHNCSKVIIITTASKAEEPVQLEGSFLYWANKSNIKWNLYNKKNSFDDTGTKKYRVKISQDTKDLFIINYDATYDRTKAASTRGVALRKSVNDFIKSCKNQNVCIICDESHRLKDMHSIQALAVSKIKNLCTHISNQTYAYLLTGTPFTRGFEDLYNQLKMLGWDGNKALFMDMFCIRDNIPTLQPWQQPIVDYKNIPQLFNLVHKYAITIKSEKVLKLPEQVFTYYKLPQTNSMRLFTYKQVKVDFLNNELKNRGIKDLVASKERDGKVNNLFYGNIAYPSMMWIADSPAKFYMRARQLSIGFQGNEEDAIWFNKNRLKELEKLLSEHEDNYVLFYNYSPEFVELYEICEKLGYKIDIYNGIIKSERYYMEYCKLSDGLKLVEKKRIILVNYASGAEGKNWQQYNKCILFSLPTFSDYQQGLKRIHRPGQKETVIYYIFTEDNWLDKRMLQSLNERKEYDKQMFIQDLSKLQIEEQ